MFLNSCKKIKFTFLIGTLLLFFYIIFSNAYILNYNKYIIDNIKDLPNVDVALIFGGGMKKDGITMSEMQTDRMSKGIELYKSGKIKKIMITGDDGKYRFNEVEPMKNFALQNDVKAEDIMTDPHGYNTYSSCYRASQIFGLEKIVVISQSFHLPRIIFFCRHQNIESFGLRADLRNYSFKQKIWPSTIREILARAKGWGEQIISKPLPISLN